MRQAEPLAGPLALGTAPRTDPPSCHVPSPAAWEWDEGLALGLWEGVALSPAPQHGWREGRACPMDPPCSTGPVCSALCFQGRPGSLEPAAPAPPPQPHCAGGGEMRPGGLQCPLACPWALLWGQAGSKQLVCRGWGSRLPLHRGAAGEHARAQGWEWGGKSKVGPGPSRPAGRSRAGEGRAARTRRWMLVPGRALGRLRRGCEALAAFLAGRGEAGTKPPRTCALWLSRSPVLKKSSGAGRGREAKSSAPGGRPPSQHYKNKSPASLEQRRRPRGIGPAPPCRAGATQVSGRGRVRSVQWRLPSSPPAPGQPGLPVPGQGPSLWGRSPRVPPSQCSALRPRCLAGAAPR